MADTTPSHYSTRSRRFDSDVFRKFHRIQFESYLTRNGFSPKEKSQLSDAELEILWEMYHGELYF